MMNKLLKYECMAVGRILVPIWCGTIVLSLLVAMTERLNQSFDSLVGTPVITMVASFLQVLTALFVAASLVVAFVVNIQRFYKLLGEQGYLMFSLPAAPWQHMAAKLLCACGSTVASLLVIIGCMGLYITDTDSMVREPVNIQLALQNLGATTFLVLVLVLLMVGMYLYLYLCIAIGSRWPQQRLLASIVTYFVLGFAAQMVFILLMVVSGIIIGNLPQEALDSINRFLLQMSFSTPGSLWPVGGAVVLLLFVLADGILWAVTQYLISKKLNLP